MLTIKNLHAQVDQTAILKGLEQVRGVVSLTEAGQFGNRLCTYFF